MRQHSSTGILSLPLLVAACGIAFCIWTAWGNGLNVCVTLGCTLYQDVAVGGISLWWYGVAAFGVLAALALMGRPRLGLFAAGLCLCIDILLLTLMALTAPCVGCLMVAVLFALCFMAFRSIVKSLGGKLSRSWILWVWFCLLCVNVGAVFKAEVGTWRMFGFGDDPVRLYFSPSCSACREAVNALSGRVNVGFYPVAEEYSDVPKVAIMLHALDKGMNMKEALAEAQRLAPKPSIWDNITPENLVLWFRLTRNKTHVLDAGSLTVPLIEYQGLPASLIQVKDTPKDKEPPAAPEANTDPTLPIDTDIAGSCGKPNSAPCPDTVGGQSPAGF